MEADRHREGAKAAYREGAPNKSRVEEGLYLLPAEVPLYPPAGDKFMD